MKLINLGTLSLPSIGLGTYKLTGQTAVDTIQTALHLGYRLLDTAQLYHNEEEVGTAVQQSGLKRDEVKIITKVWPTNFSRDRFVPSVNESLKKLKTDHVDLLLIHWPHERLKVKEYLPFLQQCKDEGKALEIGVSNYNIHQTEEALQVTSQIICNEVEYHPWIDQHKLITWMNARKMPVIAYCPLGRGIWLADDQLKKMARHYQKTPAQIVLRWHLQKSFSLAIPKASSAAHLKENIDVFDFELSDADMNLIDHFSKDKERVVDAQPGAHWD